MKKFLQRLAKSKIRIILISSLAMVVTVSTISFVDNDFKLLKSLDIYYTLFRELNLYYVDETDPEKLVKTSIDAMLESLDPYTVFIPEDELEDYKFLTTGQYAGIGALIKKDDNDIVISDIYEGKPAQKAGIRSGDIIVEIDGKPISKKSISDIGEMLKGDPNSIIELTLVRPGETKPFKRTLVREKIAVNNVPYFGMADNLTGYIRLSNFTEDAHIEVKNALLALKDQGAKSIVIDLRSNPGGLLGEAIDIANLFLDKGLEIVHTKGKWKQWENSYKCQNQPVDTKIPLAILVNKNSASASEIVAGSLQDLDRAVIIGQRTFGKGLVQATRPLSYNTQLKVTTARYYIPSGRCIQALDYAHRNADGAAGQIPDSLIHEFKTKNKRKVFDGGGILPDISLKPESLSRITYNLYARNYFFNYATQYAMKHDTVASPSKFTLSEEEYAAFVQYLRNNKFDYQTESEEAFEKLKGIASKENYLDAAKPEFEALSQKLSHDKTKDLDTYKPEIKRLLEEEIITRYYYQRGRLQISLISDQEMQKAIEILNDKKTYGDILSGTGQNLAISASK